MRLRGMVLGLLVLAGVLATPSRTSAMNKADLTEVLAFTFSRGKLRIEVTFTPASATTANVTVSAFATKIKAGSFLRIATGNGTAGLVDLGPRTILLGSLPSVIILDQDGQTEVARVQVPQKWRGFTGHNPKNLAQKFARRVAFVVFAFGR